MKDWWLDRSERDRKLWILAAGITLLVLLWTVGVQPALDQREKLQAQLEQAQEEYRWLVHWAPSVAAHSRVSSTIAVSPTTALDGSSMIGIIDVSARAAELGPALRRVRPLERSVEVELEEAPYARVIGWLVALEQGHGIRVVTLVLERTDQSGRVNARLHLEPAR